MPVRILHVVEAFGLGGGIENGIANLVHHMDAARFAHILCAVFRLGPNLDRFPKDRVRIMSLGHTGGPFSFQVHSLARLIAEVRPDVVHSRNWGAIEAVPAARWARVRRVIHSEHGVEEATAEPFRRVLIRRVAYSMADSVFAVSQGLRDSLVRRIRCKPRNIGVIPNGVDTRRFRPDPTARQEMRNRLGVLPGEFCIGCVGRLNAIKDYPTVLRAVSALSSSYSGWRLFIAGAGPELSALQEMANNLPGTAGRVHFTGALECVPSLLGAMDAYVLSSITEGISNSLLEAMAAELPVLATQTGGNPEVVVHDESGLLFPIGDYGTLAEQLLALVRNEMWRVRLASAAAFRVGQRFSMEAMVSRYNDLYTIGEQRSCSAAAAIEA